MHALTTDELLSTTRSVRKRLDLERPVSRAAVEECLHLALQAPNGSNLQRWRWVAIDDPKLRAAVAAEYVRALDSYAREIAEAGRGAVPGTPAGEATSPAAGRDAARGGSSPYDLASPEATRISESVYHLRDHLHRVPVLVIPLIAGRLDGASVFLQASLWGSILPAAWSFMLALRSRGLGSAWTTVHLHRERQVAEILGIPHRHYTQAGLFPVAHTIGGAFRAGRRKPLEEVVSWNAFAARGGA